MVHALRVTRAKDINFLLTYNTDRVSSLTDDGILARVTFRNASARLEQTLLSLPRSGPALALAPSAEASSLASMLSSMTTSAPVAIIRKNLPC
jgi:hypothetical protein